MAVYYGGHFAHLQLPWPEGYTPTGWKPTCARPNGRYCGFTEEIAVAFIEAIVAGVTMAVAAKYTGYSISTIHDWLAAGRRGEDPLLADFYRRVQRAKVETYVNSAAMIRSSKDWRAHLEWLRARYPKDWGRGREAVDVKVSGGPLVNIDFGAFKSPREAYEAATTVDAMRATVAEDEKQLARARKKLLAKMAANGNGNGGESNGHP